MPHLGDRLREYRDARGWNQQEMADYVGIKYRTYQDIEKTGDAKKVAYLERITQKTGIPAGIGVDINVSIDNEEEESYRDKYIRMLEEDKRVFQRLLDQHIQAMQLSLATVAAQVESVQVDIQSSRQVLLESLARLEGKGEGELVQAADSLKLALLEAKARLYKKHESGM